MSGKVLDRAFDAWESGELKTAFECFKEAAESGENYAMLDLGYFYDEGVGTEKDKEKAMYWYKRAVQAGEAAACTNIGILYMEMSGDRERAKYWFKKGIASLPTQLKSMATGSCQQVLDHWAYQFGSILLAITCCMGVARGVIPLIPLRP